MSIAPFQVAGADPVPPRHVAIIMDGNGRWANARGLPRTAGHRKGAEAVRNVIEAAAQRGIGYLTLFGFSSENWKRPQDEISDLMGLLRLYLETEVKTLVAKGIQLRVIGDRDRLAPDIVAMIEDAEKRSASNTRLKLVMALSYGGRAEIVAAATALARDAAEGRLKPGAIDEQAFARRLYTHDIPDPDLLIRTSGEMRISNFLLWQLAYTEFVFVDTLWPDFDQTAFNAAIDTFCRRERRYGAIA
jgi:undecaprenyl diphosphate synthase